MRAFAHSRASRSRSLLLGGMLSILEQADRASPACELTQREQTSGVPAQ